jgi:hypothetical protein
MAAVRTSRAGEWTERRGRRQGGGGVGYLGGSIRVGETTDSPAGFTGVESTVRGVGKEEGSDGTRSSERGVPSNAIDDGDDPRAESTGAASSVAFSGAVSGVALSGAVSDTPPDAAASLGPAPPPPGGPCARTEAGQGAGRVVSG